MDKESLPWCVKCGESKMKLIDDSESLPRFKCPSCEYEISMEWNDER